MIQIEVELDIPTIEVVAIIECTEISAPCADATVRNSDNTFNDQIASGGTLVLDDVTFQIYVDGVLKDTEVLPSQVNHTLNINLE